MDDHTEIGIRIRKRNKEKLPDVTKALEIISGYSKMRWKGGISAWDRLRKDSHVHIWKLLGEKNKKLIESVKKDDIYIDYPVMSYFVDIERQAQTSGSCGRFAAVIQKIAEE